MKYHMLDLLWFLSNLSSQHIKNFSPTTLFDINVCCYIPRVCSTPLILFISTLCFTSTSFSHWFFYPSILRTKETVLYVLVIAGHPSLAIFSLAKHQTTPHTHDVASRGLASQVFPQYYPPSTFGVLSLAVLFLVTAWIILWGLIKVPLVPFTANAISS